MLSYCYLHGVHVVSAAVTHGIEAEGIAGEVKRRCTAQQYTLEVVNLNVGGGIAYRHLCN